MKLGLMTAILPDVSLEWILRFASQEEFACIEVMCWPRGRAERRYAGVTHLDVSSYTRSQAEQVREQLAMAAVSVSALGYYPNPLTPVRAEAEVAVKHLKKVISAAGLLGVNLVTTFVGRDWTKSLEENWPRFLRVWKPLVRFAEDRGVRIAIENCPMLFTGDEWPGGKNLAYSPAIWRRMFEEIPSKWFGLNYDPSHLIWQQMDEVEPLREFASRIFHVHAKDVRADKQRLNQVGILATPLEYHTPKLPGLGEVDWRRFFSVLGDVGYDGPVCIEVEDRACEGSLEKRKQALRQSARFLRQFMPQQERD